MPGGSHWNRLECYVRAEGVSPKTIGAFLCVWEEGSWLPHTAHERESMDRVFDHLVHSELLKSSPQLLFTPADWITFQALPKTFTVYRGYRGEAAGRSWTLDRAQAEFFALQAGIHSKLPATVMSMRIPKSWPLFYSNSRFEQEIIFDRPMESKRKHVLTPKEIQEFIDRERPSTEKKE